LTGPKLAYLDSSALVKLVVEEAESVDLEAELGRGPRWVTSALAAVEVRRVVRRSHDEPPFRDRAEAVLAACALLSVDARVLSRAAALDPPRLRTLDAIHLASALEVGDDLGAFVAYDRDLVTAARAHELETLTPGE
jgi:predicted nucleic acid-binding protein